MVRKALRPGVLLALAALVALPASATAAGGGSRAKAKATATARAKKRVLAAEAEVLATGVDNSHVRLQWKPVPGATSYQVLRAGLFVGRTTGTSYTDALLWPRTTYVYEVDALSGTGLRLRALRTQATTPPLPASGFPRPFSPASFWNTPVGDAPSAPNANALQAYFQAHVVNPNLTLHVWGVAVSEANATDPTFAVPCTFYADCTLGAFGAVTLPPTAAPDPSADGHLAVVDPSSQREWDMWQARRSADGWSASAGAAVATSGDGIAPEGTASGDAANFPLLGGLVRPEEILQGRIDHALVFGLPGVSSAGHVCPATHNDGSSTDPNALREGTRMQLDPSVDVDALPIPAWQKTIARALQTYGMYLRDQGGSLAIWGENPIGRGYDAWAKVGLSGDSVSLAGIPWGSMRVVAAPC